MLRILFLLVLCLSLTNCSAIWKTHYSKPTTNSVEHYNSILKTFNSQLINLYSIKNVYQDTVGELTFALLVHNSYDCLWTFGPPLVPIIPLFGWEWGYRKYFDNKTDSEKFVYISVSFETKDAPVKINPCDIELIITGNKRVKPSAYACFYDDKKGLYTSKPLNLHSACNKHNSEIIFERKMYVEPTNYFPKIRFVNSILLKYPLYVEPLTMIKIKLPQVTYKKKEILLPTVTFHKDEQLFYMPIMPMQ